jgi:tetratricopeptide (TPR) repeat protein
MRFWMKPSAKEGFTSRLLVVAIIIVALSSASFARAQQPAPGNSSETRDDREVILKHPGTGLYDSGHYVSSQDTLTFTVERAEGDRVALVSRDGTVRGWVFSDQVVPLDQASEHLARVVANDPRDADAYWIYARVLHYRRDTERALAHINRAIRLKPGDARFYVTRALVRLLRQQPDQAIEDCNQAITIDPKAARPYAIRAQAWLLKNDTKRARADLEHAFRRDDTNPSPPDSPARGAAILRASARDDSAKTKDPETAADLVKLGEDHLASRDYDKAIDDFSAAIRLTPTFGPAYIGRARTWAKKHYRDRELADYTEAIRREPANAAYLVARAESCSAQGMHKQAMADFDAALAIEPTNPSFWVSRGNEWRNDLRFDDAIADYTHALQINPRYAPAYVARGLTWKQQRAFDRAIQEFTEFTRVDPENALSHMLLARLLATCWIDKFRNGQLAVAEATRACELTHWQDPDSLDTLAAASAEVGDFAAAVKWQTQAIKLVRQNVDSFLQKKATSSGGQRGVGFDDRLAFYKSKKPTRE